VRSWAFFEGPVRRAVHKLKYQRDIGLAERLSRELIKLVESWQPDFELVTAVPLDRDRQRQRGFNQALLLARPVAWAAGRPCRPEAIIRIRKTASQVGLSRSQRISNVRQAFRANGKVVRGCAVLIIDDVMSTGATIEASSLALREAGAAQVYGLTLARSVLN
jgi:ComF family protein